MHLINRRNVLIGLPLVVGIGLQSAIAQESGALVEIEKRHGGRLGFFAVDTGSGRSLAHRENERFLMCSTIKGCLAALVLERVDAGQESLSRIIHYVESDLIFTSPVTKANVGKGGMAVGGLITAILEYSDNTAAILLMRSVGGPGGLTKFVKNLGDTMTSSDRYEPNSNQYNGVLDTTSPRAMVATAQKLLLGDVLKLESRARLEAGMVACKPGVRRIRASMPGGWTIADRTGENVTEESNDYALVRPPGRAPLLLAIYYDAPDISTEARKAVIRESAFAFVEWCRN